MAQDYEHYTVARSAASCRCDASHIIMTRQNMILGSLLKFDPHASKQTGWLEPGRRKCNRKETNLRIVANGEGQLGIDGALASL